MHDTACRTLVAIHDAPNFKSGAASRLRGADHSRKSCCVRAQPLLPSQCLYTTNMSPGGLEAYLTRFPRSLIEFLHFATDSKCYNDLCDKNKVSLAKLWKLNGGVGIKYPKYRVGHAILHDFKPENLKYLNGMRYRSSVCGGSSLLS